MSRDGAGLGDALRPVFASWRERVRRRPASRAPRFEVHVPVSPTPTFMLRVRLLAASLRRFAGADCRVVVTVSRDVEPYDLAAAEPWSPAAGVEWRWVERDTYEQHGIWGTAMVRFTYDFEAPFVLMLDADTLCTGPLAELPRLVGDGIGGVMAWVTPMLEPPRPRDGVERTAEAFWRDLFAATGVAAPPSVHEHPGWRVMAGAPADHRFAPPYFNLGMLAARGETMRALAPTVMEDLHAVDRFADTRFRCQIGLTVSAQRAGRPLVPLPLRFNFPNSRWFWDGHPDEHDVRLLHYANTDEIDRERLREVSDLQALVHREDLSPPNALMRDRVASLLAPAAEPSPLSEAS